MAQGAVALAEITTIRDTPGNIRCFADRCHGERSSDNKAAVALFWLFETSSASLYLEFHFFYHYHPRIWSFNASYAEARSTYPTTCERSDRLVCQTPLGEQMVGFSTVSSRHQTEHHAGNVCVSDGRKFLGIGVDV